MIRFLILIAVGYVLYRSVKSWIVPGQHRQMGDSDPDHIEDVMVKDPVCQVYFPQREGIRWRHGGKAIYFCSHECLEKFKQIKEDQIKKDQIKKDK